METRNFNDLQSYQQDLILKAESVMRNAYNLISGFYVGSALLTKNDRIYVGTCAENSSAGMTICAERTAIFTANTAGERMYKSIAIIGRGKEFDVKEPVAPCGACRQVIYDFAQISGNNIEIICSNTKKTKIILTSIEELLPLPFGSRDLDIDVERFRK